MSPLRALLMLMALTAVSAFTLPARVPALAAYATSPASCDIIMGRGDKRTAKGKRKAKSFGNSRPRNAEIRKRAEAKAGEE